MKKKHQLVLNSKNKKKNFLVVVAIGKKALLEWNKYSKPLCLKYCKKYSLGLIVITDDLIDKEDPFWKKATWQKMLVGNYLNEVGLKIKNICILDLDILINPNSPNIFDHHDKKKISVVSMLKYLPYDLNFIRKRISFNRNRFYSKKYKLDSALFMNIKQIYKYHKVKPQKDFACSGLVVFNSEKFSKKMKSWFYKYKKDIDTLTGGGEQPIWNYEVFKTGSVKILDYKFQALWIYEIAFKYPFLYEYKNRNNKIIKKCIEASLEDNYFLHFAGKWEAHMWKTKNVFNNSNNVKSNDKFLKYLKKKSYGKPIGRILPKW